MGGLKAAFHVVTLNLDKVGEDLGEIWKGVKMLGEGLPKLVGGTVIAGVTAFAVAIGVGAPAVALLAPISAGLNTVGLPGLLALGPVITAAHAGLATAVAAVASAAPALIITGYVLAGLEAVIAVGAAAKAAANWVRAKVTNKPEVQNNTGKTVSPKQNRGQGQDQDPREEPKSNLSTLQHKNESLHEKTLHSRVVNLDPTPTQNNTFGSKHRRSTR